ncbi:MULTISPECIES: LysR family transcriptional regulator [Reinekea]|jgi:DNA-binding transcriptional LysR family regulator|uniref:Transcriptional regulator, LysR family n=1 Tax=Reinekea forsetii TaxID=1336806 RepID=A0A2K8KQ62_9GAMM|nr:MULTISPECIES: LysR family transcriptional regulator [Reinekea]ATX75464.1 transcriptional regulator, LysR family [Reinekea forsetii]|tara:strand:- start:956 stop:1861 length:906 start_codon:yes stop_codon:yes gene_type:complete
MRHLQPLEYFNAIVAAGSIRKAAETLSITSTALNRRLLAIEEELGVDLFERLPKGVQLSAAGEILLLHIREQIADMARVKSQISDLKGERRGHVAIACSQAILTSFLPVEISKYRSQHPFVTFSVQVRDRAAAEEALLDRSADLALVFEPVQLADFQTLLAVKQSVWVLMPKDHPLAHKPILRLRECLRFPVGLPTKQYGVRHILEASARRISLNLAPVVESDSFDYLRYQAVEEGIITFQIEIGLPLNLESIGLVACKLDERDVPDGVLYVGQLKGRTLPVAGAKFANQILAALGQRCDS